MIVATASPGARSATQASFIWYRIAAGHGISSCPSNFARTAIELMLVKIVTHILLAKLDRVHANLVSEFVEQRLHSERSLRMARGAHGDRRVFVGLQRINLAIRITDAINCVGLRGLRSPAHAAKSILGRAQGDVGPIFLHARFEFLPGARTIAGHHEFVVARQHKLDWSLCFLRKSAREHSFDSDSEFRAKATAHMLHRRGYGALRQT